MRVKKRDNSYEPVNVNKIINVVLACSSGLNEVDPMRVATKVISGLYDGASTKELDRLCIRTASFLISDDPDYSKLSARLLIRYIHEEVETQGINNFFASVKTGYKSGLINKEKYDFIRENKEALNIIIDNSRTQKFEYFGLKTVYDRYLLKAPVTRQVIESPQYFFLRVACGLSSSFKEAKTFYDLISNLDYMPSSPTLFNSAGMRSQLSSCYLLDSPKDDLSAIYDKYKDVALLSKFAGGIGLSFSRIRSRGSLIKGTNGKSNGIIPFLKTLDSSVAAVNQGGRRKGAACIYLDTWHQDIEAFLELRDNTGDEQQRTHNLNLANWVPDLFMKRVEEDKLWSLFDPKDVPEFVDSFGEEFEEKYQKAEEEGLATKTIMARKLYAKMMKTLAETGNGWMNFKDHSNKKSSQTLKPENVIHLSNLCTEILEVTSEKETAVCNLGSINISNYYDSQTKDINWKKLADNVSIAITFLDKVIDINFYPIGNAKKSNKSWRPVGLGLMGLQDLFFKMQIPFESPEAFKLTKKIQEEIYYHALSTSCDLAKKYSPHKKFSETRASQGHLQFDLWNFTPKDQNRWDKLKALIKKQGLRNSLIIAIAPTATISSIVGVHESIEPQISNLFKRETLSGEFLQINKYLVQDLKKERLWTSDIKEKIKLQEGSIQNIAEIPQKIKELYKTSWEISQKTLIDMAIARGPYIDQSQSLNLFVENPTINKLSSMYMYAWKKGLKTSYYLRSRPASSIAKVTVDSQNTKKIHNSSYENNLETPEICESCQ
ncbi:MAG: ribonucleoside-diphosphate reductase subunit alpha [Bdellovibrionales bacterium]|nr:ribonucleoside-diphosphate reductase subunit alpha [Bdellovibrionales bacterium]